MNDALLFHLDDRGVATLTLNRPQQRNAFDDVLIHQLQQRLDALEQDDAVRILVLRATGKHFSAGADINWMRRMGQNNRAQNEQDARKLARLMHSLNTFCKPTIALVQGAVYGGGVGLVACCDLALAADDARFCLSEVRLGLIPAVISPYVIEAIGARQARRYFQTAEVFDADKALRIGLLHEVARSSVMDFQLDQWIADLLKAGPQALMAAKQLIHTVTTSNSNAELTEYTVQAIATQRSSREAGEGLDAFLTKRKPRWQGKN